MDFEIKIIEFLQAGRTPFFDGTFQAISLLGSYVGVIGLFLLFLFFKPKLSFWFLGTYGFAALFANILKSTICRVRPFNATETIVNIGTQTESFSMPSGHAVCATVIAIFLGYFLFKFIKKRWQRAGIAIALCIYVGLVMLSRMYLGKHYLTDLIAGVALAVVVSAIGLGLLIAIEKRKKNEITTDSK